MRKNLHCTFNKKYLHLNRVARPPLNAKFKIKIQNEKVKIWTEAYHLHPITILP